MNRIIKTVAIVMIFGILIGAAYAEFARPDDAIKYRKAVMTIIAQHFSSMGAMVKGRVPYDRAAFAGDAAVIESVSMLAMEAFMIPGSDKGQTTMKSSVFENPTEFSALAQTFEMEVGKLSAAAKGGNVNAAKTQFGVVARSCKACHSKTRR